MSACSPKNNIAPPVQALQNLFINAKYFLDSQFGNDSTAINFDEGHQYQNLQTVLNLVQPGEVVFVQPGTYSAPVMNLNGGIWYFSAGSVITTLVTGDGSVFGFGQFVGQSPVINFSGNKLFFQAQSITTQSDYAVYISSGESRFDVTLVESPGGGFYIDGNTNVDLDLKSFDSSAVFIHITDISTGEFCCHCQDIDCATGIESYSNNYAVNLTAMCVDVVGEYFALISDLSSNPSSMFRANISINKINCSGVLKLSGISSVTDTLKQPRVNFNIQTINSVNNSPLPIFEIKDSLCNLTYDSFGFMYTTAIPYIIVITNGGILHIDGKQTFNSDQSIESDVGFASITATGFAALRGRITELFLTSQVISCTGSGEVLLDITSMTNISSINRDGFVNSGQCIIHIQKLLVIYTTNVSFIRNTNIMRFDVDVFQCQLDGCRIVNNQNQLQLRMGYINISGSNNVCIRSTGTIIGILAGSIRFDGPNNTALNISGTAIVEIGQIIGHLNPGNSGVYINDPGQLYGRIGRILMQNNTCLSFNSSKASNLSFDWIFNSGNSNMIVASDRGEVTLSGNSITAISVTNPIRIVSQNSHFNLNLVRLDISGTCTQVIYLDAFGSDVNIDIQHFHVVGAVQYGVYVESGNLILSGNYLMDSSIGGDLFFTNSSEKFYADLGFVMTNDRIINSLTTGEIWYKAEKSVTKNASYNIQHNRVGGTITASGYFITAGGSNIYFQQNPTLARVLNATLVSQTENVTAANPVVSFVCNGSVGNKPLITTTSIPASQFVFNVGVA